MISRLSFVSAACPRHSSRRSHSSRSCTSTGVKTNETLPFGAPEMGPSQTFDNAMRSMGDALLSHSYDTPVCSRAHVAGMPGIEFEVARSRLKNVTYMHDGGGIGPNFGNAEQTRAIIDCAASFPHLTKLQLSDCAPAAACASIAAHVRAGRFTRLECLDMPTRVPTTAVPVSISTCARRCCAARPGSRSNGQCGGETFSAIFPLIWHSTCI